MRANVQISVQQVNIIIKVDAKNVQILSQIVLNVHQQHHAKNAMMAYCLIKQLANVLNLVQQDNFLKIQTIINQNNVFNVKNI